MKNDRIAGLIAILLVIVVTLILNLVFSVLNYHKQLTIADIEDAINNTIFIDPYEEETN